MLSMIMPVVPPEAVKAELGSCPKFSQLTPSTPPSLVIWPTFSAQVGTDPPVVPALVAYSMLLLLSRILLCMWKALPEDQVLAKGATELTRVS